MIDYSIYRRELEKQYIGTADIYEMQATTDPVTHITSNQPTLVLEDEPCKLSYKAINPTDSSEAAEAVKQQIKLFISPNIEVKPGSKITVTQNGTSSDYEKSGKPAVYPTHQEIILKSFEGWS